METISGLPDEETIKVETGFHCFLCWADLASDDCERNPVKVENGVWVKSEVEETAGCQEHQEVVHRLDAICQYLKLELDQISGFSVTLCGKCGQVVEHLTGLCLELEEVKKKVLMELGTFHRILEGGMQAQEMEGSEEDHGLVTGLKRSISQKSDAKLNSKNQMVTSAIIPDPEEQDQDSPVEPSVLENEDEDPLAESDFRILEQTGQMSGVEVCVPAPVTLPVSSSSVKKSSKNHMPPCDLCGTPVHRLLLSRHKSQKCPFAPPPKPTCDICALVFNNLADVQKHKEEVHGVMELPPPPPVVENPGIGSRLLRKIRSSKRRISDVAIQRNDCSENLSCDLCGQEFHFQSNLELHQQRFHQGKPGRNSRSSRSTARKKVKPK